MFCTKCGNQVADGMRFCTQCGAALPVAEAPQQAQYQQPQYQQPQYQQPQYQQPQYQQPQYQQPQYQQPQYQQPQYQQPQQAEWGQPLTQAPALGMNWFKFLIYFGLWAGAVLNAVNGITMLTGSAYDGAAELVYRMIDGLQGLDIIMGICLLAVAALGVYARFRLAGYRKNGPKMLNAVYIAVAVVQVIYVIGLYALLPESVLEYLNLASAYGSIAGSAIMVGVNTAYFKNRAHLFVND